MATGPSSSQSGLNLESLGKNQSSTNLKKNLEELERSRRRFSNDWQHSALIDIKLLDCFKSSVVNKLREK
jgi:hypothetical protein